MDHLPTLVQNAISGLNSYAAYRKVIANKWPTLDAALAAGPYQRYAENLYLFIAGMSSRPPCPICSKELKYIDRTEGYRKFCSTKCAANCATVKDRQRNTNANKNSDLKKAVILKRTSTMYERYGVAHALQHDTFKIKVKEKTAGLDWGVVNDKRKATIKEKYGVDNLWESDEFREQLRKTNLEKYGVEWVQQSAHVREKRIRTKNRLFYENLVNRVTDATPLFTVDEFQGVAERYQWKCNTCLTEFYDHIDNGSMPTCPSCYPSGKSSSLGERELVNWLVNDVGVKNLIQNTNNVIGPKELDIWLPDYNLAIEFNGLYWHSEKKLLDKNYHRIKHDLCEQQGIRLIQIFSDEWDTKPNIVKDRLLHIINKSARTCAARQCTIRQLSKSEYDTFMESTHIQGTCLSPIRLGAFYQGRLVAAMGFGQNRAIHRSKGWELLRFAVAGNVPGIAGKLFKHFVKHHIPESVFSYCDIRWGTGKLYESIGMVLQGTTPPGYWYSKDGLVRVHRFSLSKQKLVKRGFDPQLTESEITKQLGYYKIWDAGHKKFLWKP